MATDTDSDPNAGRGRLRIRGFDAERVRERESVRTREVQRERGTDRAREREIDEARESDRARAVDRAPAGASGRRATGRRALAWRRFARNRTAVGGLAVVVGMVLLAVFARPIVVEGVVVQPVSLAPHDPGASTFAANRPPSAAHPFGTDRLGRDVLSRVLYGGRFSLSIGAIAVGLAVLVGVPAGAVAGYVGGWIDEAVMRLVDVLYAFPFLVLAIAVVAVLGQGFWRLVVALVAVGWIDYARLVRGEVLSVTEEEYVTAARALGVPDRRILARHVVPNAIAPVVVQATLGVGTVVLAAAALGFLGLGLGPGTAEWGSMLSRGRASLLSGHWWITVFPGLAIFLFVLSINLVGDGARDALDPGLDSGEGGRLR